MKHLSLKEKNPLTRAGHKRAQFASAYVGFPGGTVVKNPAATAGDAGDTGSIPGSGGSPGGGRGSPLQCSCLENPTDRGAWQPTVHGFARVRHDFTSKPPPYRSYTYFVRFLSKYFSLPLSLCLSSLVLVYMVLCS